jgi:hypothetical protein
MKSESLLVSKKAAGDPRTPSVPPGIRIVSFADPQNPYVDRIGSDSNVAESQIWELGNSLGFLTRKPGWNGQYDRSLTNESGKALLACYNKHN